MKVDLSGQYSPYYFSRYNNLAFFPILMNNENIYDKNVQMTFNNDGDLTKEFPPVIFVLNDLRKKGIPIKESIPVFSWEYRLRSVVFYGGNASSGHYFAVCRTGDSYFEINSGKSTKVNLSELSANKEMRLSFYDRVSN